MGLLSDFLASIERLQAESSTWNYRFEPASKGFWLLEAEDDEEILGGILYVQEERVYAISEDVERFVRELF